MQNKYLAYFIFVFFAAVGSTIYLGERRNCQKEIYEEGGAIALQDRMDLAMQQEFQLTRDPVTNTVPKERLITAMDYAEQLRHSTRNAISGISWTERGPNNIGGRTRGIMIDPNDATKKTVWTAGAG